jgi:outer membrane protein OmpA-like peptidoglycan-associated protein
MYAGFGATKDIVHGGNDFLPMVPFGLGVQTRVGSQVLLEVNGGYNLLLSDKLDGRQRADSDLNVLTNKKQDSFFGFIVGLTFTGPSGDSDPDKDGLLTKFEKELGTNAKIPDTDGDGLNDGAEVNKYKTDPLKPDTDGDGIKDGGEVLRFKTDPLKDDTDGDGLKDGVEVRQFKTDPLKTDTDDDGLNDGAEVYQFKTNPQKADTDGDGLKDGAEVNYRSDPLVADTDGDGLTDGAEVNQHRTDPTKADTDGDGLNDGHELKISRTDPLRIDTDDGGANDGVEIQRGTNPMDPKDDMFVLEKGKKVILQGVVFESNKAILSRDSDDILEVAYGALVANPDVQVEISGHTDSIGSEQYNQTLSLQRAQAVRNWLSRRGVAGNRMKTVGKGEDEPVASNNTAEGRAENRRIEFYVQQ